MRVQAAVGRQPHGFRQDAAPVLRAELVPFDKDIKTNLPSSSGTRPAPTSSSSRTTSRTARSSRSIRLLDLTLFTIGTPPATHPCRTSASSSSPPTSRPPDVILHGLHHRPPNRAAARRPRICPGRHAAGIPRRLRIKHHRNRSCDRPQRARPPRRAQHAAALRTVSTASRAGSRRPFELSGSTRTPPP